MDKIIKQIEEVVSFIDKNVLKEFDKNFEKIQNNTRNNIKSWEESSLFQQNYTLPFLETIVLNHLYFIKEALVLKDSHNIVSHLVWEFKTYHNLGLPLNFFKYMINYLIKMLHKTHPKKFLPIENFYREILLCYEDLLRCIAFRTQEYQSEEAEVYEEFFSAILKPNMFQAIEISNKFIKEKKDIQIFWEHIILPSLYNLGIKWSNGEISVGEEHTATSICQWVMSQHYDKILDNSATKKDILVTIASNELHQIGARMIADFLELNGYNVYFSVADKTFENIIEIIKENSIENILISTTMVANIEATKEMIRVLREYFISQNLIIYVGGQAYKLNKNAFGEVNADHYITTFEELMTMLERG